MKRNKNKKNKSSKNSKKSFQPQLFYTGNPQDIHDSAVQVFGTTYFIDTF